MAYTKTQVKEALKKSRGVISAAAKRLGCERQTIYNYRDRYEDVRQVMLDAREDVTDFAELKLIEAMNRNESWAISLYLKTQGKNRGYVERMENVNDNSGNLTIRVIRDDA